MRTIDHEHLGKTIAILREVRENDLQDWRKKDLLKPLAAAKGEPGVCFDAALLADSLAWAAQLCDSNSAEFMRWLSLSVQYHLACLRASTRLMSAAAAQRNMRAFLFEDGSYIHLGKSLQILSAFACGEWACAIDLAQLMQKHWDVFHKRSHPKLRPFGRMVVDAGLERWSDLKKSATAFIEFAATKDKSKVGFGTAFLALTKRDLKGANAGVDAIVAQHGRMSGPGSIYGTYDSARYLSLFGLGVVNYLRHHGLKVEARPPLIPEELVI